MVEKQTRPLQMAKRKLLKTVQSSSNSMLHSNLIMEAKTMLDIIPQKKLSKAAPKKGKKIYLFHLW
jgi:hypothetical protein